MAKAENKTSKFLKQILKYLVLIAISIIVVFPFYIMLIESFHPNLVSFPYPVECIPTTISLQNYQYLFSHNPVLKWISNSLVISIGTSVAQVLLCSMAAFGFQRTDFKGKKAIESVLMIMLVIPIQTRILPTFLILSKINWVNTFLAWIPFLVDAFGVFLMMQYMESIPNSLDEASFIDGASLWQTYSMVIMPQTKPAMVVLFTFNFINQWNDFLYPLIMIRSDRMYTLQLGVANIFSSAQRGESGGIGVALAAAVISFVPTLVIYLVFQKQIVTGVNLSSGIKG